MLPMYFNMRKKLNILYENQTNDFYAATKSSQHTNVMGHISGIVGRRSSAIHLCDWIFKHESFFWRVQYIVQTLYAFVSIFICLLLCEIAFVFCSFFCCQSSALSPSLVIPYCGDPFKCLCVKRETKHIHRVWCCFIKCNERVIRIRINATLIRWFIQLWIMLMQFIRLFVFRWICKSWFCCKISMNWYQRYEYRPDSSVVMCMRIFFLPVSFVRSLLHLSHIQFLPIAFAACTNTNTYTTKFAR